MWRGLGRDGWAERSESGVSRPGYPGVPGDDGAGPEGPFTECAVNEWGRCMGSKWMCCRRSFVVGVACVSLLAACGGGSRKSSDVTVGHLTLTVPEGWTGASPNGDPFTQAYGGDGMTMQIAGDWSKDQMAWVVLDTLVSTGTVPPDYMGSSNSKIAVPGADSAEKVRFSYTGRDDSKMLGCWLIAASKKGCAVVVTFSGRRLDDGIIQGVADSMRLKP